MVYKIFAIGVAAMLALTGCVNDNVDQGDDSDAPVELECLGPCDLGVPPKSTFEELIDLLSG